MVVVGGSVGGKLHLYRQFPSSYRIHCPSLDLCVFYVNRSPLTQQSCLRKREKASDGGGPGGEGGSSVFVSCQGHLLQLMNERLK